MQHLGLSPARAHARELLDPGERVERVAAEEMLGALDRPADPLVLVAPVRLQLRRAREVEVVVRRSARRPRGTGQNDAKDVLVEVLADQVTEGEELATGLRREPLGGIAGRLGAAVECLDPPHDLADLRLERKEVVPPRLDSHEQTVEGGDVDARPRRVRSRATGRASSPSRRTGRAPGPRRRRTGRAAPRRAAG